MQLAHERQCATLALLFADQPPLVVKHIARFISGAAHSNDYRHDMQRNCLVYR
jgi:hypothetical protein